MARKEMIHVLDEKETHNDLIPIQAKEIKKPDRTAETKCNLIIQTQLSIETIIFQMEKTNETNTKSEK